MDATPKSAAQVYPEDPHLLACNQALLKIKALVQRAPTLQTVAQALLSSHWPKLLAYLDIRDIHVYDRTASAPLSDPGKSLLALLQEALAAGREPTFDLGRQALYASPDPLQPGPPIPGFSLLDLEKIVGRVFPRIIPTYERERAAFWKGDGTSPKRLLELALLESFNAQATRMHAMAQFDDDALATLSELAVAPDDKVHGVTVLGAAEQPVALPGVYLVGDLDAPANVLYLWTAGGAIERFASLDALRQGVLERLGNSPSPLKGMEVVTEVFFSAIETRLFRDCADALVTAHGEWTASLLAQVELNQGANVPWQARLQRLERFDYLTAPAEAYLATLMEARRDKALPPWLRNADSGQRQEHNARQDALAGAQRVLDRLLENFTSYPAFARKQVKAYIGAKLGMKVDPDVVSITARFKARFNGKELDTDHRLTLSQWVLETADPGRFTIQAERRYEQAGLTADFLAELHRELDLRVRFHGQHQQLLNTAQVRNAFANHWSRRLGASLFRARLQQVIAPGHARLIDDVRLGRYEGRALPFEFQQLLVNDSTVPCRDFVMFKFSPDEFVLYAPGAVSGIEFISADRPAKILQEVSRWCVSDAGAAYVKSQLDTSTRLDVAQYLKTHADPMNQIVYNKVSYRTASSASLADALDKIIDARVEAILGDYEESTPAWYRSASRVDREQLGFHDKYISLHRRLFREVTDLPTFDSYCRATVQAALDNELKASGFKQVVDAGTLVFQYHDEKVPFIDRVLQEVPIPSYNLETVRITSLEGQRLPDRMSAIVRPVINSLKLAEPYMNKVKAGFLNPAAPNYLLRYGLNLGLFIHTLERSALIGRLQQRLTPEQSTWLAELVNQFKQGTYQPPAPIQGSSRSGIYRLRIGSVSAGGLYVLRQVRSDGSHDDLVYTPDAPDGIGLRTFVDLDSFLLDRNRAQYFVEKVRYHNRIAAQKIIRDWDYPPEPYATRLKQFAAGAAVVSIDAEFTHFIDGILDDVDQSTITAAERFSLQLEQLFYSTLTAALVICPPAAAAFTLLSALRTFVEGVQAYREGDNATAFWAFFDVALAVAAVTGATDALKTQFISRLFPKGIDKWMLMALDNTSERYASELLDFLKDSTLPESEPLKPFDNQVPLGW